MPDSEWFDKGTDLRRFVKDHPDLKGKHLIYIVQSNTKGDRFIFKTGSSMDGLRRAQSYVAAYGWQVKGSPQSGGRLWFFKVIPKRGEDEGGTPLVRRYERALEAAVAAQGGKRVAGRGRERWRSTPAKIKAAVDSLDSVFQEVNAAYQEQKIRRQPPREASTRGCECRLKKTKTARGGVKYSCEAVAKYVPAVEPPGQAPVPRARAEPKFQLGDKVSVKYEDGQDYTGRVTRLRKNEIDVVFTGGKQITTIPRRQWGLVKLLKRAD